MKRFVLCLFLVLFTGALFAQEPKPGRIRFDVKDVYLDTLYYRSDTVFTQQYHFVNEGESPISFAEVSAGCACLEVLTPEPVQPGEAADITVHFTPHWAGDFHHRIGLVTDGIPHVCFISLNIVLLDPKQR